MNALLTLLVVLAPMFVGFLLPKGGCAAKIAERALNALVFVILMAVGVELSQVENLQQQLASVASRLGALVFLTIGSGLLALFLLDRFFPLALKLPTSTQNRFALRDLTGCLIQLSCLALGFVLGARLGAGFLPSWTVSALLAALLFLVGLLLKNADVSLKDALFNRQGARVSAAFMGAVLASGAVFASIFADVSLAQGLALASGFGWYSLSGAIMTDAYGALWGSVALFNDLLREIAALLFIPYVMRLSPQAAVGLAGVTGLDFSLPTLKKAGGNDILPVAISFGVITNIASPILMVFFTALD